MMLFCWDDKKVTARRAKQARKENPWRHFARSSDDDDSSSPSSQSSTKVCSFKSIKY